MAAATWRRCSPARPCSPGRKCWPRSNCRAAATSARCGCAPSPPRTGHALFGDLFLLHFAGELARDHRLDRGGGNLLADSLLAQPAVEAGPYVRVFSRHDCTSDPAVILDLDYLDYRVLLPR